MAYRKLAFKAVIYHGCSQIWKEAIRCSSRLVEAYYYLPGERVFFWKRGLQARLKYDQEKITYSNNSRPARQVERWYGPAVVIGHT